VFLTDFVFVDDMAIRYSVSLLAAVTCLLGGLLSQTYLKPYTRAIDEASQRMAM
jgi:hypothetical protein